MIVLRSRSHQLMCALLGFVFVLVGHFAFGAEDTVEVTEITTKVLVFSTTAGNVVASVGPDGALLVGTPPVTSTPRINSILASRTKSSVRYVVIAPQDLAHSGGDAAWGRRGAFVAMHENALRRLGGDAMGAPQPLSPEFFGRGSGQC
jgi:cyclase